MTPEFEKIARVEAKRAVVSYETEQALRLLSFKKRKSPSILVMGRDGFSDNSKYLYLALVAKSLGFPVIWGTFNPKLNAELARQGLPVVDLSGHPGTVLSLLIEVSCVVYCTNPVEAMQHPFYRAALAGAHKFQLWHGIGLKTLDLQNTGDQNLLNRDLLEQLMGAVDIDEVLSPSSLYDDQWREAFGVEHILRAGFPRNEVLVRPATEHERINAPTIPAELKERGFLLYAPTYSRRGTDPVWLDPRLIELLEGFAQHAGMSLVIKPHPFDREPTGKEAARLGKSALLMDPEADVYPVLQHAGAMVTDVSSMVADFLLCDKPVLFFRSKTLETRDYPEQCMPELPGPHIREESLKAFVAAWDSIGDTAPARRRLRQLYFETDPLQACDTIIQRLLEVVEKKP